jgi:hypothetical protein
MKKKNLLSVILTVVLFCCIQTVFSQVDPSTLKNATTDSSHSSSTSVGSIIIAVLVLGGALFAIGHMVYLIFKSKRFNTAFSVDGFKQKRTESGKESESTEEENNQCYELLNAAFDCWTNIEKDESGIEYRKPKKMKEIVKSAEYLQQVVDIAPTNQDIIDTLNEYGLVVSSNEKRSFDGSWKLIILGIVISVLMSMITKNNGQGFFISLITHGIYFWLPVIVYYVSSLTPQFLIEKRANRGGGNLSTGLVAVVLAVLASGRTVRTHYTDGTHEDDNSSHVIALVLGAILAFIIAFTIIFWAALNYLRNYVLYF